LWGEGGTERREGDVEVKEVLEEGRERREPQGVRNLREIHYVCVGGREFSIEMKRGYRSLTLSTIMPSKAPVYCATIFTSC